MTHIAVGVGGYVTHSQSNLDPSSATANMIIRVPVNSFENAINQIESAPGIKVLNDSENGTDVSAQYVNVQAKIQADSGERNSLLVLLSHASNLNDILTLRDKITEVQGVDRPVPGPAQRVERPVDLLVDLGGRVGEAAEAGQAGRGARRGSRSPG